MTPNQPTHREEETGVDDVRRVRENIARQHKGDLAEHVAETDRIAESLSRHLGLGPVVQPPPDGRQRSGTAG